MKEFIKKTNIPISICNDKIICNTSLNKQHKNFTKVVNDEIECTNKVRYITLKKIMYCLLKVCKKKNDEINKNKNKK